MSQEKHKKSGTDWQKLRWACFGVFGFVKPEDMQTVHIWQGIDKILILPTITIRVYIRLDFIDYLDDY